MNKNSRHINSSNKAEQYRDLSRYRNSNSNESTIKPGSKLVDNFSAAETPHSESVTDDNLSYKTAQYSRKSATKYSHKQIKSKQRAKKRKRMIRTAVCVLILIVLGIAAYKLYPIKVTINGVEQTLTYDKSLQQAINQSEIKVTPGNFIAVDLSPIELGGGYEYYAEINGEETSNLETCLNDGDSITYDNGKDKMEDCDSKESSIIASSKITGTGAVHKFYGTGKSGTWSKMTGKVSQKYAERQTKDPEDVECKNFNINPGQDKVIALTFDDGPDEKYTTQILELLKKYNAKATFFVVGERLEEDWGKKLVAKEDAAGHQVCTHTYDHARGAGGVDITHMTAEKQIEEVTKGQLMISNALGKPASKVCRLPGGNLSVTTVRILAQYVDTEIGWNIDTNDWKKPGKSKILQNLNLATNGNIILCHDGGGERSQTIEAVSEFLQTYTEKGYKFITIDELLQYPQAEQKSN